MMNARLSQIYYDPDNPASYGGANALARVSGVPLKDVQQWLKSQSTYSLHKPARKRYLTRQYRTSGMHHLWQTDLSDLQAFTDKNDGYRYILCVIDVFSRKARANGIKSKRTPDVQEAFEAMFRRTLAYPLALQSDHSTEFESRAMATFFETRGIHQYSVKSQFKASL